MTDSVRLLRNYAKRGDEDAFRELVARYVDLVYSTAVRRLGGDTELARDATQTVFTDLARKARALSNVEMLGGWLHRHTGFVAATLVRSEQRRQARERIAAEMNALQNSPDTVWQQLAPLLDEAIESLATSDRQAIVLRFFERRDFRAIGTALGISDDAAQKRVSRALEKLRGLLADRGATLTVALLANLMAAKVITAAPAGLTAQVSKAALAGGAAGVGLAWWMAKLWGSIPLKLAAGMVGIAAAIWLLAPGDSSHNGKNTPSPDTLGTPEEKVATESSGNTPVNTRSATAASFPSTAQGGADSNRLVLTFLAADVNKPIPNVMVDYWVWGDDGDIHKTPLRATRFGVCEVPVRRDSVTQLILVSEMEGFADTRLEWRPDRGETIPYEYTLRLARSVPIGGRVVDADGNPVGGAKISFGNRTDIATETFPESRNFGWPYHVETVASSDGSWHVDRISREALASITGAASHPKYVHDSVDVATKRGALQQLLAATYTFKLGRAVTVRGDVVSPDGQPVAEAKVLVGHVGESGSRETKSRADGTFSVEGCRPGKNVLSAEANGFAPTTLDVELVSDINTFKVTLLQGRILRLRVVDHFGRPITNAGVWLNPFSPGRNNVNDKESSPAQVEFKRKTDANGRLEWLEAPNEELIFGISATGYMRADFVKIRPDGQEHVITLQPALTISGTVRDAVSGKPIPRFRIITGWPSWNPMDNSTNSYWSKIDRFWLNFEGGKFHHVYEEPVVMGTSNPGFVFKFEAEDHRSFVTRAFSADEGEVRFDVALQPGKTREVTVLLPDGRPAVGADIGLVSPGAHLQLVPGGLSRDNVGTGGSLLRTDEKGRFRLPPDDSIVGVIAAHAVGYVEAASKTLTSDANLRLLPWGKLEGKCDSGNEAAANVDLLFEYGVQDAKAVCSSFMDYRARTDATGHFVFAQVPAGKHKLVRLVRHNQIDGTTWIHQPPLDVEIRPGETTTVNVHIPKD